MATITYHNAHVGDFYDVEIHATSMRDTYPNNFRVQVIIKDKDGKMYRRVGYGKYIGNFSPIWVDWYGKRIQVEDLLKLPRPKHFYAVMDGMNSKTVIETYKHPQKMIGGFMLHGISFLYYHPKPYRTVEQAQRRLKIWEAGYPSPEYP